MSQAMRLTVESSCDARPSGHYAPVLVRRFERDGQTHHQKLLLQGEYATREEACRVSTRTLATLVSTLAPQRPDGEGNFVSDWVALE